MQMAKDKTWQKIKTENISIANKNILNNVTHQHAKLNYSKTANSTLSQHIYTVRHISMSLTADSNT